MKLSSSKSIRVETFLLIQVDLSVKRVKKISECMKLQQPSFKSAPALEPTV